MSAERAVPGQPDPSPPGPGLSGQALADLAGFATDIAARAGRLGMGWFRHPLHVETKADASPVTEADRAVESFLREAIATRFPGHAILGEEFGREGADGTGTAAPLWVIDPIDGTRSFMTGWPLWGVLLALVAGGRPLLGVVELPALGERLLGIAGEGTRFTDARGETRPCRTRDTARLAEARFYTTSPRYFDPADRPLVERLVDAAGTARFGGDCYGYAMLAAGHVDLVVEAQLAPYDYMALVPVIEGAGGIVTDWAGAPLGLGSDGRVVAAATPALHAEVLALLAAEAGAGAKAGAGRADVEA